MQIHKYEYLVEIIQYIVDKDRNITSSEISSKFGIKETTTGWMNTRAIIKEAIRQYATPEGIPIGANNKGYFEITEEFEMHKYRDNLVRRIKGMEERCQLIVDAWNNKCKKGAP